MRRRELITPNRTCEVLGIDEIAIRKGHVYATVLYDHTRKSVIHMLQGRDRKSVHAFFKAQGKEWCESVKVVTCDLWRVYKSAVRKFLPNATVVTDKFHVFKYAGDALEELRRSEYNRQADKVMDFDLKRGRFLLLKSNAHLDEEAGLPAVHACVRRPGCRTGAVDFPARV